ncbi:hypothetical protein TPA0906_18240 [Streptomyces olivaceus]|uniref:TylF/MycF family methyltransferase n=1 Tax=Streptomyces olivaceus TaxID=47716 RepID=UPI001CCECA3E|nr:TylF/MycF family methyltransferase [Streptomyces olivaceus]MBZ6293577.1 TylF/MycF family methyltransferase [Streptomyces olivaceus]MBZ6328708.1 TylF/MycF family methyltransferase [Streptomyces olivaceus]GHI99958.1 hypothetical protein TPA0906_18240 [Streptomyces olivaceus]
MIGTRRPENVEHCVKTALADGVPGDFMETGVWRGGTRIVVRAVPRAYDVTDRCVWMAGSFRNRARLGGPVRITGPIQDIDGLGVYWRREASVQGLEQRK